MQRKKIYIISLLLIVLAAIAGILLGHHYSHSSPKEALVQPSECNTMEQTWQAKMNDDPNGDFSNIKVYKVVYSQTHQDCLIATYMILPPGSPAGESEEWLEIDILGTPGANYWFQTYPPMPYSDATKILDEQLAEHQ